MSPTQTYVKDGKPLRPWETARLIFQLREAELRKAVESTTDNLQISKIDPKELTK